MTCIHLKVRQCTCARAPTFNRAVPSIVCGQCAHYEGPARGAGDIVHAVTTATGIARVVGSCGACAERRVALNKQSKTWLEWFKCRFQASTRSPSPKPPTER
jgi:hypothetical protein